MANVYKGGRNRKEGARYDSGQLRPSAPDHGTIEQRLKREMASGDITVQNALVLTKGLDKLSRANIAPSGLRTASVTKRVLTENILTQRELDQIAEFHSSARMLGGTDALDILLSRRIIDRDQFEVAMDFTACWCAYIGRPWPKGWRAERQSPDHDGGISEDQLRRMKISYWNCLAAMDAQDRLIFPLVRDVVIHGKAMGIIEDVLGFDVVRTDDGRLIGRLKGEVPPTLRLRIGRLTKGIDIISDIPRGDYSREAVAMLSRLRQSDEGR